METATTNEGWVYLKNSPKWHYIRNRTSLCNKFLYLGTQELEQGNNNSPDNCAVCRKKLEKEKAEVNS
ncbi:hypothetical protein EPN18_08015 [bacterium]|nr:MAG: hypothetical protein EPN18_08015 [bacterium]